MKHSIVSILACLIFFGYGHAYANGPLGFGEAAFTQEMQTDRPDFTEGTQTVQPGHFQVESGYTFVYEDGASSHESEQGVPEALLRIGLSDSIEGRIFWQGYVYTEEAGRSPDGLSDLSLGAKMRLYEEEGFLPELSLIGELFLPTGSSEISADEFQPGMKLLWAYSTEPIAIAGNVNATHVHDTSDEYTELSAALSLGADLGSNIGAYAEYFGLYPLGPTSAHSEDYLNGGFTYGCTENLQLDIRAGFGLNSVADDFFSGAGLTFRM